MAISRSEIKRQKAYSETCQTPKLDRFAKIVSVYKPLTILVKSSILDV